MCPSPRRNPEGGHRRRPSQHGALLDARDPEQQTACEGIGIGGREHRRRAVSRLRAGDRRRGQPLEIGDALATWRRDTGRVSGTHQVPEKNILPRVLFYAPLRAKFVTVSTCTGTDDLSAKIQTRTGGQVENMEGAAARPGRREVRHPDVERSSASVTLRAAGTSHPGRSRTPRGAPALPRIACGIIKTSNVSRLVFVSLR